MNRIEKILLVGHCGFDAGSLTRAVEQIAGDRPVTMVNTQEQLDRDARSSSLLLVNRVLDGRFHAHGGIELIAQLAAQDDPPKMMLISNYDDAQRDAQQAGALPGFGKADINNPQTQQKLQAALDGPES